MVNQKKVSVESIFTGTLGVRKVDESHLRRVLKDLNVACNTSTANIISKDYTKERNMGGYWENNLTSDSAAFVRIESRQRFAIGQHGNVACGALAHVNISGI